MVPLLIGPLISPGFMAERHRGAARHGTDVRDLPVGQHEVTGLDGCASFFGGLLQVMLGLGAIGQFLGLLRKQGGNAFVPEFVFDAAANLFETSESRPVDRLIPRTRHSPAAVCTWSGGDFSAWPNTALMNCGELPMPGKLSVRLTKSVLTTLRPLAAAALSNPALRACDSNALT